ncbi:MAG: hypothetical protein AABZ60_11730, partial [Planctomycetota bacterium]
MNKFFFGFCMMGCISLSLAQETQVSIATTPPGKVGDFLISFTQRSPLSSGEEMRKRYGWTLSKDQESGIRYSIAKE